MGHLLKSINPEAVERIERGPQPPDVGTMVVYMARAGMQRMGRREFPAIVLASDSDGYLELFVLMEPEDMIHEAHVRFHDQHQEGHCWRHVEVDEDESLEAMRSEISTLKQELAALKKAVLGEYKPAKLSVYELLHEFETKLKG